MANRINVAAVKTAYAPAGGSAPGSSAAALQQQAMKDYWLAPAVGAGLGTVAARYLLIPESGVTIMGSTVSTSVALFAGLYVSSLAGKLAFDYILPQVSRSDKFLSAASLLEPGLSGAANLGVWQLAAGSDAVSEKGWANLALTGAVSDLVGNFLYYKVIKAWV